MSEKQYGPNVCENTVSSFDGIDLICERALGHEGPCSINAEAPAPTQPEATVKLDKCSGCGKPMAKGFHDIEPDKCNYCGRKNGSNLDDPETWLGIGDTYDKPQPSPAISEPTPNLSDDCGKRKAEFATLNTPAISEEEVARRHFGSAAYSIRTAEMDVRICAAAIREVSGPLREKLAVLEQWKREALVSLGAWDDVQKFLQDHFDAKEWGGTWQDAVLNRLRQLELCREAIRELDIDSDQLSIPQIQARLALIAWTTRVFLVRCNSVQGETP